MHAQEETELSKLGTYETVNALNMENHGHHDQYGHYSHEMPEDTAEAWSRVLIRSVPIVYGALFGGMINNLPLGILLGVAATAALDANMGHRSLLRRGFGRLWSKLQGRKTRNSHSI